MAEATEKKSKLNAGSIMHYGLFVLVLLGYFSSEAFMRRLVYNTPSEKRSGTETDKLISSLPEFLQSYLKAYAKRLEIQDKLKVTTDTSERVKLLFELSALSGAETVNQSLMMKIIEEAPYSHDVLPAYLAVMKTMPDEEAMEMFVNYARNCDIRRPRPKVKLWAAGAHEMAPRSKKVRLKYYEMMLESGIMNDDLGGYYEELWVAADSAGKEDLAKRAKDLHLQCQEKAMRKYRSQKKK